MNLLFLPLVYFTLLGELTKHSKLYTFLCTVSQMQKLFMTRQNYFFNLKFKCHPFGHITLNAYLLCAKILTKIIFFHYIGDAAHGWQLRIAIGATATSISSYPAAQQTSSMTEHHRTAKTGPGIMMMVNQ